MKSIKAVVLACAALVFAGQVVAEEIKTIRWGVDGGYPPFDVLAPNGEITGFDPDIAKALCAELKAECVFVKQPFESMIAALNAKKYDAIIASLSITPEREKEVAFTEKYYASSAQLVARKGSNLKPDAQALAGKVVGVQTGSIHETYAKQHWAKQGVKVVAYANQDNVYLDLMSGRIDAALQDKIQAATSFLNTDKGKKFEFAGPPVQSDSISASVGIAVGKDNLALRDALNQAIRNIRANGTYNKIRQQYFSFDIYGD